MQNKDYLELKSNKEYQNQIFLNVLSSYVCGKDFKIDSSFVDWKYLFSLSMEQGLGCLMYKAVENIPDVDKEAFEKLEYYYQKAFFMCAARNELLSKISSSFEENGIDFVILKGAVIQGFYPSPELRVMSDIDFLIHEEHRKKAKSIIENLNVKFQEANSYQDIYVDSNGVIIEVHHALWGYDLEQTELFSSIWKKENLLKGKKHTFLFSNEDLYIFTITHMLKHFRDSGIGIRPVFDLWYILKRTISTLDFQYIKSELLKIDAYKFEKNIRAVVNCIFLGKERSEDVQLIIDYLMRCGTHGNIEVATINESKDGGKAVNVLSRLFPPLGYMKRRYRVLEKLPFLLPVFYFIRIMCLPFKKDRIQVNLRKIKTVDPAEKEFVSSVFKICGIEKKSSQKSIVPYVVALVLFLFVGSIFCIIFFQNESINNSEISSENSSSIIEESIDESSHENSGLYGTISWKGGIYTGYLINNIPNGSGEHIVENKMRYVGVFLNGSYDGVGKIEYSDGSKYEGMFKSNQANGEGTLYCANGDIISGIFTNGQPGGFCNYEYSDGNLFVGTMVNGLKHGEGTFSWLNGDKYVGSFVDDKRDGYGVLTYANGDVYTGSWSQGFWSGYGVYVWKNGKKYEGRFENGIMNDTDCKITFPDGSVYSGEISEGLQNGKGTLTYPNGDIAKGTFSFGYLSGQADYYFFEKKLWIKVIYEKGEIIKYIID